jgi:DNA polymerase elongation subunit (family B)
MKLPFNFDPENSEHLEWVEINIDYIDKETLKSIYNIVDVDIKNKSWSKFTSYNIKDVELVDRLEDKMKLIELALTMAYDAKVNYSDVFSQVSMWDTIIYNYLKKRNVVIPPKTKTEKTEKYAGAYVKEPVPGVYDYVVSFDLTSLYPSLIMQFNVSPETLLEDRVPNVSVDKIIRKEVDFGDLTDKCVTANGCTYRKDFRGFLPELMEKIFKERSLYKEKMLEEKRRLEEIETEMKQRGLV